MATVNQLIGTGNYDTKKLNAFYNRQIKANIKTGATQEQAESLAEAMVRIYKHTFEIKTAVRFS